ncbi:MAG TPA: hypothetical protein VFB21_04205 [Chthonomonadaceae bacterium]|nr:hypothetical protein [Chthonomonadaceae bacterium]
MKKSLDKIAIPPYDVTISAILPYYRPVLSTTDPPLWTLRSTQPDLSADGLCVKDVERKKWMGRNHCICQLWYV